MALLAQRAELDAALGGTAAARALAALAARTLGSDPHARAVLDHAIALGRWGMGPEGTLALSTLERGDLTGLAVAVRNALSRAERLPEPAPFADPADERVAVLLRAALEWQEARGRGLTSDAALAAACEELRPVLD